MLKKIIKIRRLSEKKSDVDWKSMMVKMQNNKKAMNSKSKSGDFKKKLQQQKSNKSKH